VFAAASTGHPPFLVQKRRAAFWFGSEIEVRYVAEPPEVGNYVTHRDELWRVSNVDEDELGLTVVCKPPQSAADNLTLSDAMRPE
jgi:hypothetical protein